MSDLASHLRQLIERDGPISAARYMAEALTHPKHGYYMRGDPFGAAGDFTTAPEISQMFGELVGLWCVQWWNQMGRPASVNLVELGPGRGTLMADALRAARAVPAFRAAIEVHLVEISPALRAHQRAALKGLRPCWHDRLASVPDGPLILVANEFFDSLPIRQFQRAQDGWRERLVGLEPETGAFRFVLDPRGDAAARLIPPAVRGAPVGAIAEASPAGLALAREIGERLTAAGGAALIIDYGHARSAPGETLQAVRRHASHDVLAEPGTADLTAHVDFESLARAAAEAGARVYGPIPQGEFLEALGVGVRAEALIASATPAQAAGLRAACRRLTDPAEMGALFKVLALADPRRPAPAGFEADP